MKSLKETVKWSDRIGFVYWLAVLSTIHFGLATSILTTMKNRLTMMDICRNQIQFYNEFYSNQNLDALNPMDISSENEIVNAMGVIDAYERNLQLVDWSSFI